MKIINKTRKYLHVRMTQEEYNLLTKAITKEEKIKTEEQKRVEYAKWFFTNHIEHKYQDEYSSWHSDWINIHTKQYVNDPGFWITIYKTRFLKEIKELEKKYK